MTDREGAGGATRSDSSVAVRGDAQPEGSLPGGDTRRSRRRERSVRRRRLRLVLLGAGVLLLATVAVVVDAYVQALGIARQAERTYPQLETLRGDLLKGQVPQAQALDAVMEDARALQSRLDGTRFTFGITAAMPWVGTPLDAVRLGGSAVTEAARAGEVASSLIEDLFGPDGKSGELLSNGRVDVALLEEATPRVEALAGHIHASIEAIRAMPEVPFFGRLETLKAEVLADAEEAARLADRALSGFRLLPTLLGADSPQTYFVALQNNADQRGTGGAVLAYGILRMDEGKIDLVHSGPINEIDQPGDPHLLRVGLPEDLRWYTNVIKAPTGSTYGATRIPRISNGVNYSPQFPKVARVWAEQVANVTDLDVHGVIAVDPFAVAYALKGEGTFMAPPYPSPIHAGNVVEVTEHDQYALPRTAQRALPPLIVAAAFEKLVNPRSVLDMGKHLATAFAEKRIQVWSAAEDIQGLIAELNWDGGLDTRPGDFLMVTMNKRLANKVDYFTRQEIDHHITVSADGEGHAVTTVRLINETPPDEAPYIVGRWDPYALNVSMVNVHVPRRARSVELTPDEPITTLTQLRPKAFLVHQEARTRVYTKLVEAWPDHPAEMTYTYDVPGIALLGPEDASLFRMQVRHQPLSIPADLNITIVLPEGSTITEAPPGWTVDENTVSLSGPLTRAFDAEILYSPVA